MQYCRFEEQDREELDLLGPPQPGEILREEVLPRLRLSQRSLAARLNVSRSTVSRLLKERSRISIDLAARLAQVSGSSALYWLVLQAHHDAWRLERGLDTSARREFSSAPWSPPESRRPMRPGM